MSISKTGTNELLIAEGTIIIIGRNSRERKNTTLNQIAPLFRKIRYKRQIITAGLNHKILRFHFIC
jgi:hypothetical protein